MAQPSKTRTQRTHAPNVSPVCVDVDLVRFEKNLLQIGFFGANDARDKNRTSRRIEQAVYRNGHKITVAAEFRGSEALGLPSTTDRDKFIALLKIISEERLKTGHIENPIRFSGYRLINELGLSRNGEIYEEILRWGKRMTDTTITSEQVVYQAAKKVYSDEVLHVFRSFRRTGSSNLTGADRQEHYEVVLEDWLLENLNQRYVVPEDFNAYKQLARPTAKGIFGNLHLWFHASQGRQVEKDYTELCTLLNIQAYPHLSKIKSTMGLALNELVEIQYISQWDVQPMSSKKGYKIVLQAGEALLRVLDSSRPERKEAAPLISPIANSGESPMETPEQREAIQMLTKYGVLPARAALLVEKHGTDAVIDTVEYLASQMQSGKRTKVDNPAGLIIYSLENALPVPVGFMTDRRRREAEEAIKLKRAKEEELQSEQYAYDCWVERKRDEALTKRYPEPDLQAKLAEIVAKHVASDPLFRCVPPQNRPALALAILRKEVRNELTLPPFEQWRQNGDQISLF